MTRLPDLPDGWSVRSPGEGDVADLAALRLADHTPYTGEGAWTRSRSGPRSSACPRGPVASWWSRRRVGVAKADLSVVTEAVRG
ncbi:MAG: hypothetical protein WAV00_14935 [Nocardioides sp.]